MTNQIPLRIPLPLAEVKIDPHLMEDACSMEVVMQVHRGLLRYSPQGEVFPDLAKTWKVSTDHKTYTFEMDDAFFSDGTSITPEHVVQSFARIFYADASIGADLSFIAGTENFKEKKDISFFGVKAVGPNHVEFKLSRASSLFVKQLAAVDCAILKLKKFSDPIKFDTALAVSGPYKISEFSDSKIVLEKWRKDKLDSDKPPTRIEYLITKEDFVSLAESDSIDSLDRTVLDLEQQATLSAKGWKPFVTELVTERFVILNPKKIPTATRRYLYNKIDPLKLAQYIASPALTAANGLIPNGIPGALSKLKSDTVKESDIQTPTGKIELEYVEGNLFLKKLAEYLKINWEAPGFSVLLKPIAHAKLLEKVFRGEGVALLVGKGLDYFDGFSVLSYFRSGYSGNFFHVHNSEIDKMLDDALAEFDSACRTSIYEDLQISILKNFTMIPLLFGSESSGLWGPSVEMVPAHPGGSHTLPLETIEMK